jgi:hypothetical protein
MENTSTISGYGIGKMSLNCARGAFPGTDKLNITPDRIPADYRPTKPLLFSRTQLPVVPQGQASRSEKLIMIRRYQMTTQVEQIVYSGVRT